MKLDHISVVNTSVGNAVRFYQDYLGLDYLYDFFVPKNLIENLFYESKEFKIIKFGNSDFVIETFIIPDYKTDKKYEHICIDVENINLLLEKAKQFNVKIRIGELDGVTKYFISDYDNNLIEFKT